MIRLMTEKDIPVVLDFICETLRLDPHFNAMQRKALQTYATPQAMENAINHYYTIVDEWHDHVVGMASLNGNHLVYIYVDPLSQGHGIGRILMEHILNYFKRSVYVKGKKDFITVFSTESAVPFYEKFGFQVIERIKHKIGSQEITRIRMQLNLQ